jgi:hypothetical protein
MESITKYRQPPQTLRRMIERAYGSELVPAGDDFAAELGHGWFNVAYLLRTRRRPRGRHEDRALRRTSR